MTLVLTEASVLGIAMAADSAVTFPDGRSFLGVQKLLKIPSINAGISAWGNGKINGIHTDRWLHDFINTQIHEDMSPLQTAEAIAAALNQEYPVPLENYSGMHIAGYDVDEKGERFPAIYHVHNGHHKVGIVNRRIVPVDSESPREFRAHRDHPPQLMKRGESFLLRNGDILVFSYLFDLMDKAFKDLYDKTSFAFPYPHTLENHGEYLRIWINFIGQIYRHSSNYSQEIEMPPNIGGTAIGGPITVLTIDANGIRSFYAS